MAKTTSKSPSKRDSFYELVFAGSPKVVRGLLAGASLGAGQPSTVIFNAEAGIEEVTFSAKLAELVRIRAATCHVVVAADLAALVRKSSARLPELAGIELTSCRHIRSAELPFEFAVYARHYHREILALLHDLPAGLRLRDFQQHEDVDPSAKGPEAYAPAHDFEARGKGEIVGRVDLLVEYRRRLTQQPLIQEGRIDLKLA